MNALYGWRYNPLYHSGALVVALLLVVLVTGIYLLFFYRIGAPFASVARITEQVWLGRQHKDICVRLKDDIAKARKEYDRRFQTILDHPVDYFYSWMVEILADGDAAALGEYPYPSAALRR